jgi:hypothetical protein
MTRGRTFNQPGRTFNQPQRNAPSIAFGGSNAAANVRNGRNFAATAPATQSAVRGGSGRSFNAPGDVTRSWDRGNVHEWRHHHFRFENGGWVIIDPGVPWDYGYPYDYGYGAPTPYVSPDYSDTYSPSDSTVAGVQDSLNRLGYSAGSADGVLGPQTRDAIADFQNDRGMPATGQIDGALLRALGL